MRNVLKSVVSHLPGRPVPPTTLDIEYEEGDLEDFALALCGIFPAIVVLWAVVTKSKTVAAFAQLGALHARSDPLVAAEQKERSKAIRDVKVHDQICFTVGVVNVALTTYLIGAVPQFFYLWHTPKAVLLTGLRWWTFKQEGKHFLLLDFCYCANALTLVYLFAFPSSPALFQIVFLVSNGPLAWAVLTFTQSLVFHSYPHMTSVFIHVSPMLLTHALRWCNRATHEFAICAPGALSCSGVSPLTMLWRAFAYFYLPWVGLYYVVTFLVLGDYLRSHKYQTLYDRVVSAGPASKMLKLGNRLTGAQHELAKKAVYMLSHVIFGAVTMSLGALFWKSFVAHTLFVMSICCASVWNASSYYFSHFAVKYEAQVEERVREASKGR